MRNKMTTKTTAMFAIVTMREGSCGRVIWEDIPLIAILIQGNKLSK